MFIYQFKRAVVSETAIEQPETGGTSRSHETGTRPGRTVRRSYRQPPEENRRTDMSLLDRTTVEEVGSGVADALTAATDTFADSLRHTTGRPVLLAGFLGVQLAGVAAVTYVGRFGRLPVAVALVGTLLCGLLVSGVGYRDGGRLAAVDSEAGESRRDAAVATLRQFPALVLLSGMYATFVLVGLLIFLLPGLYIGVRLTLGFPACVVDGYGADDSLSRAWAVTGGKMVELTAVVGLWLLGGGAVYSWFLLGSPPLQAQTVALLSPVTAVVSVAATLSLGRLYVGYSGSSGGTDGPVQNRSE